MNTHTDADFNEATFKVADLYEAMQYAKRNDGAGSFAHNKATKELREGCHTRERIGFASGNIQTI